MRSREEIKQTIDHYLQIGDVDFSFQQDIMIELLLDIRDLLAIREQSESVARKESNEL